MRRDREKLHPKFRRSYAIGDLNGWPVYFDNVKCEKT
ncbi:uncharacterized protein METZ01_LOCUS509948 [marine metagenome]|uniref:Uncharacterized protein n=1 Tax=marine metagenome TaxID=408172 RepID=A0A383EKF6_9ZZZZ